MQKFIAGLLSVFVLHTTTIQFIMEWLKVDKDVAANIVVGLDARLDDALISSGFSWIVFTPATKPVSGKMRMSACHGHLRRRGQGLQ
jgi:hypothetical protein